MADENSNPPAQGGIWITEGSSFRLSGLTITINEQTGEVSVSGGEPKLHYDVTPVWLSIALSHLREAKAAREQLLSARADGTNDQATKFMEREFRASRQLMPCDGHHENSRMHLKLRISI